MDKTRAREENDTPPSRPSDILKKRPTEILIHIIKEYLLPNFSGQAGSGWESEIQEFTLTLGLIASSCLVILLRHWFEERGYVWVQKGPAKLYYHTKWLDVDALPRKLVKRHLDETKDGEDTRGRVTKCPGNDEKNTRDHNTTPNESSALLRKLPNELLLQIIKNYLNPNYSVCLGLT
ncbi:hypothetical protein HYFRA_00000149 [Hymenoscyphus fraxineus]|uniref:Uncharacterized protein n=1 Tax=Hymenoscyphus fraxineus TaxID=746836 RepID=A0A9N9L4Y9_9HELO|nr:hypothetical protein HYFRA_00000149 [Hymenoscyphus fraxineus]